MLHLTTCQFLVLAFKITIYKIHHLEKHDIICGPEFGLDNEGKIRSLYGGKSDGADYWFLVQADMVDMHFESYKVDPDMWMRLGTIYNVTLYWQIVLIYTDDILAIMEYPERFICIELGASFTLQGK